MYRNYFLLYSKHKLNQQSSYIYRKSFWKEWPNEVDESQIEEQDERKKKKNAIMKKIPMNHISADDIEFDDPEYVEARRREEITSKRKGEAEVEKKQHDKANKKEPRQDIDLGLEEVEEDEEESEDKEAEEDPTETFKDDKWIEELESICLKMNQKNRSRSTSSTAC